MTLTPHRPALRTTTLPIIPPRGRTLHERLFQPGWPLAWLFIGYPIWWILGITEAMTFGLSAVMAVALMRRRRISAPRGFGLWLLFLLFSLVGVALLQVDAPGATPGQSGGRYLVWAFRMAWYASATTMLLYVGNFRREISLFRVARYMSWMFVTIVIGGLAGALIPQVDFPSVIEVVLPKIVPPLSSVVNIPFVQQMVHPNLAQVQQVLGFKEARPSAPFSYTNTWGLALACFLPFFVVSWFHRDAGWRRIVGPFVLLAALVPVIQSLNRGLWGALIGMAVFVALRYALMGRAKLFIAMIVALVAVAGIIVATPLSNTIALRWANQHSNEGRTDLGTLTVKSTLEKSPLVGYGTTRQVQGNFNSIAGGSTAACPKCSPPSLGTQGQAWLLIFTTGLGGFLAWVGFFALQFLRSVRLRSPYATAGLSVLAVHAITGLVYNVNGPGLLAILIGVAFLWRESVELQSRPGMLSGRSEAPGNPTVGGYLILVRRNVAMLLVLAGLGAALSLVGLRAVGVPTTAVVSVTVDEQPTLIPGLQALSLDSESQFVTSAHVREEVEAATGRTVEPGDLGVTATSNSRVLHIRYTARSTERARIGAVAAADAFLEARSGRLTEERRDVVAALQGQVESARQTLVQSQARLRQLESTPTAGNSQGIRLLNADIDRQVGNLGRLSVRLERATNQSVVPGEVIRDAVVRQDQGLVIIVVASGTMLGILLGLLLAQLRDRLTPRLRKARTITRYTGYPVVATLIEPDSGPIPDLRGLAQSLVARGARACLAAGPSAAVGTVASRVDVSLAFESENRVEDGSWRGLHPGVVIVADRRTRARDVSRLGDLAQAGGSTVLGVIHVVPRGRRSAQNPANVHRTGPTPRTLLSAPKRG